MMEQITREFLEQQEQKKDKQLTEQFKVGPRRNQLVPLVPLIA